MQNDHLPSSDEDDDEDRRAWLDYLHQQGELCAIGPRHWAHRRDAGSHLLVSFEALDHLSENEVGEETAPFRLARDEGWSHLSILSEGETWYRCPDLWRYMDNLIDEGFFEEYDQVLFYGAGMGAYAACAYSVAAPAARVLAIQPVATLSPNIAPWDRRYLSARKADFTSRFGYAPDMVAGQAQVSLIYDPKIDEDAMHAALFRGPMIQHLRCPYLGQHPETALISLELLPKLLQRAMEGHLTAGLWQTYWRHRRGYLPWLRNLARHLSGLNAPAREGTVLRAAIAKFPQATRLQRRLSELEARGENSTESSSES